MWTVVYGASSSSSTVQRPGKAIAWWKWITWSTWVEVLARTTLCLMTCGNLTWRTSSGRSRSNRTLLEWCLKRWPQKHLKSLLGTRWFLLSVLPNFLSGSLIGKVKAKKSSTFTMLEMWHGRVLKLILRASTCSARESAWSKTAKNRFFYTTQTPKRYTWFYWA